MLDYVCKQVYAKGVCGISFTVKDILDHEEFTYALEPYQRGFSFQRRFHGPLRNPIYLFTEKQKKIV